MESSQWESSFWILDYLHAFFRIFISEYLKEFGLHKGVCFYHCFWTVSDSVFLQLCLALEHFLYVMWTLDTTSSLFFGSEMPLGCHVWRRQESGKGLGHCFFYDAEALLRTCFAVRDVPVFFIFATAYAQCFFYKSCTGKGDHIFHILQSLKRICVQIFLFITFSFSLQLLAFLALFHHPCKCLIMCAVLFSFNHSWHSNFASTLCPANFLMTYHSPFAIQWRLAICNVIIT